MNHTATLDALLANPDVLPAAVVDCLQECGATLADVLLLFAGDGPTYSGGGLPQSVLVEWCRATEPETMSCGDVRRNMERNGILAAQKSDLPTRPRWEVVRDVWPRWRLPQPAVGQQIVVHEITLQHDSPTYVPFGLRQTDAGILFRVQNVVPGMSLSLVEVGELVLTDHSPVFVEALRECGRFQGRFVGAPFPQTDQTVFRVGRQPIDSSCPESVRDLKRRVLALFPEVEVIRSWGVEADVFDDMTAGQRALALDEWLQDEVLVGGTVGCGSMTATPGLVRFDDGIMRRGWSVRQTLHAPDLIPPEPQYGESGLRGAFEPWRAMQEMQEMQNEIARGLLIPQHLAGP